MRIGINQVLISSRSSGASNRDMTIIPALLDRCGSWGEEIILYLSRTLESQEIEKMVGDRNNAEIVRTPIPSLPTYKRVIQGHSYWPKQTKYDRLNLFHAYYYPVPRLDIPVVLTVNDLRFLHMPKTYRLPRYLFLKAVVGPSILKANRIIAISHFTKQDLLEHFRISENKIDVIYCPLPRHFEILPDKDLLAQVQKKYNIPENFILYVGNLEPRKNLVRLLEAYAIVKKKFNISLAIIGTPVRQYNLLFDRIKAYNLEKDVICTGYVADEDLPSLYRLANLFVFPSLFEGFGIPVLEAMACGTPVVASNVTSLPEVVGDAGILVNPYIVESIAEGISSVLSNSQLEKELITKGYERIKVFDAGKIATQVLDTYKKVLFSKNI